MVFFDMGIGDSPGEPRLPRDLEILSRICFAQFKNI